jgi:hypothetical protein
MSQQRKAIRQQIDQQLLQQAIKSHQFYRPTSNLVDDKANIDYLRGPHLGVKHFLDTKKKIELLRYTLRVMEENASLLADRKVQYMTGKKKAKDTSFNLREWTENSFNLLLPQLNEAEMNKVYKYAMSLDLYIYKLE